MEKEKQTNKEAMQPIKEEEEKNIKEAENLVEVK